MTQQANAGTPKGDGKTSTRLAAASCGGVGGTARIRTLVVRLERAPTCVG
jgi:hypothetical protein